MAHLSTARLHVSAPSFAFIAVSAGNALRRIWLALKNRRAVMALGGFDDRMLKDIGLIRSDISAALDHPMDQDPSLHLSRVAAGRCRSML